MEPLNRLFKKNKEWAESIKQKDPDFLPGLSKQQTPHYLWIGCSDSRAPANQITGLPPGEIFVHRNIANLVIKDDLNCLSVLQYAVEALKIKHVIICGHYSCGGVKAAMENQKLGLIDNWLKHIKRADSYDSSTFKDLGEDEKYDKLCELNVIEQLKNAGETSIVRNAWQNNQPLTLHGIIYDIKTGLLKNLNHSVSSRDDLSKLPV